MTVRAFCTDNKDTISFFAFVAGLIGLLFALAGLTFTAYQVNTTNVTLQATNAYTIQKDARELVGTLEGDKAFREYVLESNKEKQYPPSTVADAQRGIGRLLNFYLSVYRQSKAGGISAHFAKSFARDFCEVMKNPVIAEYWDAQLKSSSEHAELKNAWCPS